MAHDEPIRLVLLGRTGAGKSATGNTIFGERLFNAEASASSITTQCTAETRKINDKTITVVDTPGLYDTQLNNRDIAKEILRGLQLIQPGPHAFVIVIDVRRFTEEQKNTIVHLKEIFGPDVHKYTIVLFTHGDDLKADGKTIKKYIDKEQHIKDFIKTCGNRYHVFDNRKRDRTQVTEFLNKINQMLKENHHKLYYCESFVLKNTLNNADETELTTEIVENIYKKLVKCNCYMM